MRTYVEDSEASRRKLDELNETVSVEFPKIVWVDLHCYSLQAFEVLRDPGSVRQKCLRLGDAKQSARLML
jgi:hypothetical protein